MCPTNVKDVLKSEFRASKFCFRGVLYTRFFYPMWKMPALIYILIKLALTIHCLTILIWSALIKSAPQPSIYFTFLTNWTYILLTLYLTVSTLITIIYHALNSTCRSVACSPHGAYDNLFIDLDSDQESMHLESSNEHSSLVHSTGTSQGTQSSGRPDQITIPFYLKIYWILHSTANVSVVFVTIMYFAALYPRDHPNGGITLSNLEVHGISSVVMVIDFIFSPVPVRLLHVIYPIIYMFIYILFSVFYWVADHSNVIYPILDWNHPGKAILVVLGGLLLVIVLQLLYFLSHKLKLCIWSKVRH